MKKIYLSIFTALAGLSLNAQTLTDSNHSPVAGESYTTLECDPTGINPGASGAGASWNFASITTSTGVNNYTVITNANSSYPMPGIAVGSSTSNISYYKSSATDLKYYGGLLTVSGTQAALIYTSPVISAAYPMSLNTSSASITSGSISVPSLSQNGTFTGTSTTVADGTGTLTLPNGTFANSIRVVTSQTVNFTLPLATGTVTQKNYDYYTLSSKQALFTITTSTFVTSLSAASSQTFVTRSTPSSVGVKENKQSLTDLVVFPNPSSTAVNFSTENLDAKQVLIYDVTGKLVEKQNLNDGKLKLNVTDYTTGLYIYSIIGTSNTTLKTGKLTVSH